MDVIAQELPASRTASPWLARAFDNHIGRPDSTIPVAANSRQIREPGTAEPATRLSKTCTAFAAGRNGTAFSSKVFQNMAHPLLLKIISQIGFHFCKRNPFDCAAWPGVSSIRGAQKDIML